MESISHREIDWSCPECTRQPGEPCNWDGWAQPRPEFHQKRWEVANSINSGDGWTPTKDEFLAAIENDPNIPA